METAAINHLAVFTAAAATFLIGGLWYSPILFQGAWMKANGLTTQDLEKGNPARIFGTSFVFTLVMAYNLAFFLADSATDAAWGATAGLLAGLGWVAMAVGVISQFEQRPWSYMLINGGCQVISFVTMGLIIGAWR